MAGAPTAHGRTGRWESLEQWSATAFLATGVLLFGYVGFNAISGFTDLTGVWLGVAVLGTGLFGLVASIVGVAGLYPRLNGRAPRLSRGGVWAFVVAVVGLLATTGWILGIGLPEAQAEGVPTALTLLFSLSVLLIAAGFLLFAAACLRTNTPSCVIGLLLIVPVVMWIWHYVAPPLFGSIYVKTTIDYSVIAAAFLAIGYRLRTESAPTVRNQRPTRLRGEVVLITRPVSCKSSENLPRNQQQSAAGYRGCVQHCGVRSLQD